MKILLRRGLMALPALILLCSPLSVNALGLTADQESRLARGEVVLLDVLPPGGPQGGGQGATGLALVHASPETVWRLLVDFPRHAGLYPRVVRAEVLETSSVHALVRYVIGVGPFSFRFHVDNFPDPDKQRVEWHLAAGRRNDLFRANWGYWQIQRHGDDTLLVQSMAARTFLPAFLTRGAEREGLTQTLQAVRARAQEAQQAGTHGKPSPPPPA